MLQGKPEAVRRAFFALKERCAKVGLQVNDAKGHAYSRTRGAAQSVGAATGATHALRGLVVAAPHWGKTSSCARPPRAKLRKPSVRLPLS